jgi:hypothetical protein
LPGIADLVLFPFLHKGTRTTFGDFRSTVPWRVAGSRVERMSMEQISAEGDKRDKEYAAIARRPGVAKVLAEHSKGPDDIKRVANELTRVGLGYRIPTKLSRTPNCSTNTIVWKRTVGRNGRSPASTLVSLAT